MKNWTKAFLLYVMLGLMLYSNGFHHPFLMDDFGILNHPALNNSKYMLAQWNPYLDQSLGSGDHQQIAAFYRPLTHMLYDFMYPVFKRNFWQYHLFSLLVFALVASLCSALVIKWTGNVLLGLLTGLFYFIHPINGIVVNYISAVVFAFQVLCLLSAILLLWESLERNQDRGLYVLSLVFFFLSLFWHESGGVMGFFYLSAVFVMLRNESAKIKCFYLLPYAFIALAYVAFRIVFGYSSWALINQMTHPSLTWAELAGGLFQVYGWYISKLFYPVGIVMQWAQPIGRNHLDVLGLGLLMAIFAFLLIKCSRQRLWKLGLIWFFLGLLPVPLAAFRSAENGAMIEPHWMVFSCIGFFILASSCCLQLLERRKALGLVVIGTIVVAWSTVTYANNQLWADQKTYALYWSKQVPQLKLTYFYVAADAYQHGDYSQAKAYYRKSLSKPFDAYWNARIYDQLGNIDARKGRFKEAENEFQMALQLNPNSADTYDNLAAMYFAEGSLKQAEENFKRSLVLNPSLTEPRLGLALVYAKRGQYKEAIDLCMQNLKIAAEDPQTLRLLLTLGVQLAKNQQPDLAWDCFLKTIQYSPRYKDAYLAAGTFLASVGQYQNAIIVWKKGQQILPVDRRFEDNISKARVFGLKE